MELPTVPEDVAGQQLQTTIMKMTSMSGEDAILSPVSSCCIWNYNVQHIIVSIS